MRSSFGRASTFLVSFFAVSAIAGAPASGASHGQRPVASRRIDPQARSLFAFRARTGETFPTFRRNPTFERTGRLPVVVRFTEPLEPAKVERLRDVGVTFDRDEPTASGAYLARVDERALDALASDPDLGVERVSVDMLREAPAPLDRSVEETRARVAKRAAIAKDGKRLDGEGILIADIDSPLFVHHPAFFRADGGAFPFVDVNEDGTLTVGVDGIDLDASGSIEPHEVLRHLRSTAYSPYTAETIETHEVFVPDLDYLYLDTNGNGKRDYGAKFRETVPAYGEPIFVFDDADHDGVATASERVLQLKTSKVRAVRSAGQTFERGTDLGDYTEATADYANQRRHSTGVVGILLAGEPGISRWTGLVPSAELVLADTRTERGLTGLVQWAIDQKADVVLTEYAPYTSVSLDGSSEDELILDAAFAKDTIPVSPAGNLVGGRKHRTVMLQPGANTVRLTTTPPGIGTYFNVSMHYRGPDRGITMTLKLPNGDVVDVPASLPNGAPQKGFDMYVDAQTTPRGTHERFVTLTTARAIGTPKNLDEGDYELSLTLDGVAPVEMDLFASDGVSSWAGGVTFEEETSARTICNPATSEKTISVGAYTLHDDSKYYPSSSEGELAGYSSRGPTLDGKAGIDIVAPDNPISTAIPEDVNEVASDVVMWQPFGGTSGAGPHVAAAVALVKESNPKATPDEIRQRILDAARPSGVESAFGRGKLDIGRAVGASIEIGETPTVSIELAAPPNSGGEVKFVVKAQDDEATEALRARWDIDYDGKFDTDWLPLGEQPISLVDVAPGTRIGVKVEVHDGQGNLNGTTMNVDVVDRGAAVVTSGSTSDDGCGCRVAGGIHTRSLAVGAFVALAAIAARRRRKRLGCRCDGFVVTDARHARRE